MTEDDPARLQARHRLAHVAAVVLPIRQQHDHPGGGAGVAILVHEAIGEEQGVGHRGAAARLQAADELGEPMDVTGEVLMARHRVLAVAAEGQHRHFDRPALGRPAQGGNGGLLGGLDLDLGIPAPYFVAHAAGGVDQKQQAALDLPAVLRERRRSPAHRGHRQTYRYRCFCKTIHW